MKIIKRSGAEADFDPRKIVTAVTKANESVVPSARMSAVQIIQAILGDEHKILPCSVDPKGKYGQSGLYTGIPCIISKEGATPLKELDLTEEEKNRFDQSCEMLKNMIKKISC